MYTWWIDLVHVCQSKGSDDVCGSCGTPLCGVDNGSTHDHIDHVISQVEVTLWRLQLTGSIKLYLPPQPGKKYYKHLLFRAIVSAEKHTDLTSKKC